MAVSGVSPDVSSQAPSPSRGGSLGKRYLFKLLSNMATIPLFFLLEMILPRALGPAAYGNFNFAASLFQNITNFLDMGTSTCLQTALSKRPCEFGLVAFYGRFAVAMLVCCLLGGGLLHLPEAGDIFMPDVPPWMFLPVALWAYLTWIGWVARGMNDALGLTVRSEIMRMGVNLLSASVLLFLFLLGVLDITVFFAHQYVFLSLLALANIWILRGQWPGQGWGLGFRRFEGYTREFYLYSSPLFAMALCSMLVLSGERWMLQFFDGSVQQGYFSLSQKIGIGCFLFVTAMIPLLRRELAVAHGNNDPAAMGRILDRFAPIIYAVAAWFACFVVIEAPAVVRLFGGEAFEEAALTVQIMAFYPIHQGYGQVASSVYYAAGETKALRNVTVGFLLGGLLCTWIFLAPGAWGGLDLDAAGLACKMVLMQVITVNVLLFFSRRTAPFSLRRNVLHQIVCPLFLLGAALAAKQLTMGLGLGPEDGLVRFLVSGMCYTCFCTAAVLAFPFLGGVTRKDLFSQSRRLLRYITNKKP